MKRSIYVAMTVLLTAGTAMSELDPTRLRCEYREEPLGIDTRWPSLSWELQSGERGQAQRAYRILVATRRSILDNDRGDHARQWVVQSASATDVGQNKST